MTTTELIASLQADPPETFPHLFHRVMASNPNYIARLWRTDDVLDFEEENRELDTPKTEISEEDAQAILAKVIANHDEDIGINRSVIVQATNYFLGR